jgi:plasmid maintenance system antidote protein VapI
MERTQRFRATALRTVIDAQGRRIDWVAKRAKVEPSLLTHLMAGRRTVAEEVAKDVADALGVTVDMVFELSSESEMPSSVEREAVA